MSNSNRLTNTSTATSDRLIFDAESPVPYLLVAYTSSGVTTVDRCIISPVFTVGRSRDADFVVNDRRISKLHFRITADTGGFWIADLGSKNGTYVNGYKLTEKQRLSGLDVIRIGQSVFVFHDNAASMLLPAPMDRLGIVGDFHAGPLIREITATAFSDLHILVTGPSGAGKELVAKGLLTILKRSNANAPFVAHNAARFSSEEEATTTLFGVGTKVFSDVAARPGLIEQADGGLLFLDEVHNLPARIQRTLLRIVEDGILSRIGETKKRRVQVRFILASNAPAPDFGLAHDLIARLRILRIPPLKERVADIPSIFLARLQNAFEKYKLRYTEVQSALHTDLFETLCIDGFEDDNVRGMILVADTVASYIAAGIPPEKALAKVFLDRFKDNPVVRRSKGEIGNVSGKDSTTTSSDRDTFGAESAPIDFVELSHYEQYKPLVLSAFKQAKGNVSATKRILNAKGIHCSRRWLDIYLDRWGVERRRYKRRP